MKIVWRKCKKLFRRKQSPKKMMKSKLSKSKTNKMQKKKPKTKPNTKLKLSEKSMWSELLKLDGGLPQWEHRHS